MDVVSGKKRFVEVTTELVMKGMKHVCYLHSSDWAYPQRCVEWVPRVNGVREPLKPGFYTVDPNAVFVREQITPGKDGGRGFKDDVLALGGLVFVSASNPLASPAPAAGPQAAPVRPATARAA